MLSVFAKKLYPRLKTSRIRLCVSVTIWQSLTNIYHCTPAWKTICLSVLAWFATRISSKSTSFLCLCQSQQLKATQDKQKANSNSCHQTFFFFFFFFFLSKKKMFSLDCLSIGEYVASTALVLWANHNHWLRNHAWFLLLFALNHFPASFSFRVLFSGIYDILHIFFTFAII